MNRPRKLGNRDLPPNIYPRADKKLGVVYYNFKDIRTGKMHSLGTDKAQAIKDCNELNSAIYDVIKAARMASIVNHKPSETLKTVMDHYIKFSESIGLAKNTMRVKKSICKAIVTALGSETAIRVVDVRDLAEMLSSYDTTPRMRQSVRSEAILMWKTAMHEGWVNDNVPEKTRSNSAKVKRDRLTLEMFNLIHAEALKSKKVWIARSMELALVTAQRESDISMIEFRKSTDSTSWVESDALCVCQIKSQGNTKLRIPLDVGVNGLTVGGVLKSCRSNVVSKWVMHQNIRHGAAKVGDRISASGLSRGFAEMRDQAGITGDNPPTFHEIRSLSIRLYSDSLGEKFAQAIAGHKNADMTAVYRDVRGSEWLEVKAS